MNAQKDTIIEQQMRQLGVLPNSKNPVNFSQTPVNTAPSRNQLNAQGAASESRNQTKIAQLTEQGLQAKRELEILVTNGKSKDLTGKILTFNDLDNMLEKDLLKFYGLYQSAVAARVNHDFTKIMIKSYSKLTSCLLPIKDEEKLYSDLRNDYILASELERWVGYFCLKMGSLTALASTGLITVSNCDFHSAPPTFHDV